jgi:hypothetical protein
MKTKAKSAQIFAITLWSKKYYGEKKKRKDATNIYNGYISDVKNTKKKPKFFDSAGDLLKHLEDMYKEAEEMKNAI